MSNTEILIRLRDLHEELSTMNEDLASDESVDDETIELLGEMATDLSQLLDRVEAHEDKQIAHAEGHDLLDRLRQYETEHPRVTRFLSQVTDILGMMGI